MEPKAMPTERRKEGGRRGPSCSGVPFATKRERGGREEGHSKNPSMHEREGGGGGLLIAQQDREGGGWTLWPCITGRTSKLGWWAFPPPGEI